MCGYRSQSRTHIHGVQRLQSVEMQQLGRLDDLSSDFTFNATWAKQFGVLYVRATKQAMRDKLPLVITLMQTLVIGIMLGIIYSEFGRDQRGIQDLTGLLFFIAIFAAFSVRMMRFPTCRHVH